MRSDFSAFMWQHESFIKWTKEIANSTKPPLHPDLPQNYFLDEYAARHNLTGDALDELLLFYSSYATLDAAQDLANVGVANDVWRQYKQDKEWMVASPNGYADLARWLARGVPDVRLAHVVEGIEYSATGVSISLRGGGVLTAGVALVTVPLGVLQAGGLLFSPPLPPWKQRAVQSGAMGVLEKIYLVWKTAWWPNVDAFWRVKEDERFSKSTCNEWYSLHNLHSRQDVPAGSAPSPPAPVLLATPAGYHAITLERQSDEQVMASLREELQTIFPNISVPAPVAIHRTRWHRDEFARGSYAAPPVGVVRSTPPFVPPGRGLSSCMNCPIIPLAQNLGSLDRALHGRARRKPGLFCGGGNEHGPLWICRRGVRDRAEGSREDWAAVRLFGGVANLQRARDCVQASE